MKSKYEWRIVGFTSILRDFNLYENKHIPEQYFWGDFNQRIELVRGLMDSDGTCGTNGMVSFCNTDKKIIDGMKRVIESLGVKCFETTQIPKLYGKPCSRSWHLRFNPTFNPFGLKRKADRFIAASRKTNFNHYIVGCKKVSSVPVQCISVSSPSSLFLAGKSLIPTHNSAKSHAILAQIFCDDCVRIPGLKVLMIRKIGTAGKEQIDDFEKKLLSFIPHSYPKSPPKINFQNGSFVILGNFKDENDIQKYLGLEYDLIYIMESNQLTQSKKINILSCLRTSKPNWRPRCYQDTNPGGIDHVANKQIFVDGRWTWDGAKYIKIGVETETRYVHSTVDDNRFIDSGYKEYLEKLVGWQREAWLHGSWEFMAGAFFSNFHPDTHVYPNPQTDLNTRAIVRWFAGLDYGYSHPSAFLLCAEDEGGNIFCVAEYTQSNTLIEEHAANIRDICSLHGIDVSELEFIAAGKDCFRVDKDGSTVATEYQEHGILLTATHIDRINAWSQVAEVFGDVAHQIRPKCFIHKNCTNLISQIQCAQSDPKKPNDILKMNADPETGEGGDDVLEGFRNGIVMAYSGLLKNAKPINFSGWKGLSAPVNEIGYTDTGAIIADAEEVDLAQRS
jgi:phage terminase large subunit